METNELKKIWSTLAEQKLINKELARENIKHIITRQGNGILGKMKKKLNIDYYIHFIGLLLIPLLAILVHIYLQRPFVLIRPYIGLVFVEIYFIYMAANAYRNRKFISFTRYNLPIKSSIERVKNYFEKYWHREYWVSLLFGFSFLGFTLLHFIGLAGGIRKISFSVSGFQLFVSWFIIVLLIMVIAWPFILKNQYKVRFSKIVNDLNKTINELNTTE